MGRATRRSVGAGSLREMPSSEEALRRVTRTSPRISQERERELGRRIQENGDGEAIEELVQSNLRLVLYHAYKISRRTALPIEDLFQEAIPNLYRAAERFDPERGVAFSTYASLWIQQGMQRAIDNQSRLIRLPVNVIERLNKMRRATSKFEQENQRRPRPEELAEILEWELEEVHFISTAEKAVVKIDGIFREKEDGAQESIIPDPSARDPLDLMIEKEQKEELLQAINSLPEKERGVVLLTLQDWTLQQCGHFYGLTRERIYQIRKRAMERIKENYPQVREMLDEIT